ncbi:hypothetical protein Hanom_Chr04g00320661 [Helianthus anomalus]
MLKNSFKFYKLVYLYFSLFQQFVELKNKQFSSCRLQKVWFTSSATDVCRCGPQTTDVLPLRK